MGKRNDETRRKTTATSGATTGDALEQRVVAFAEQLGRIAGTFQAKAEGWMDRDTLTKQIASVRDGAAELLERLAGATEDSTRIPAAPAPLKNTKGRSGGGVDAPGKKHRKPMPADPGGKKVASQAAKVRAAKTMVKTNRHRGRG
jgi:hypothetical protein